MISRIATLCSIFGVLSIPTLFTEMQSILPEFLQKNTYITNFLSLLIFLMIAESGRMLYLRFVSKPFLQICPHIKTLRYKYESYFRTETATEKDYIILVSEIRAIFCKYFKSNEIAVTLFSVYRGNNTKLNCKSFIRADIDGFVGTTNPERNFEEGEGFVGKSLEIADKYFGSRKEKFIFNNKQYKRFRQDNSSSAYSFWCFPIFSNSFPKKENICFMMCIETAREKNFNKIAQRDDYSQDIRTHIDVTLREMYNSSNLKKTNT